MTVEEKLKAYFNPDSFNWGDTSEYPQVTELLAAGALTFVQSILDERIFASVTIGTDGKFEFSIGFGPFEIELNQDDVKSDPDFGESEYKYGAARISFRDI